MSKTLNWTPQFHSPCVESPAVQRAPLQSRDANGPFALRAVTPNGLDEIPASQSDLAVRAKDSVEAAVRRGVIPPRNFTLRDLWLEHCTKSPEMISLLDSMPGNPVLTPITSRA